MRKRALTLLQYIVYKYAEPCGVAEGDTAGEVWGDCASSKEWEEISMGAQAVEHFVAVREGDSDSFDLLQEAKRRFVGLPANEQNVASLREYMANIGLKSVEDTGTLAPGTPVVSFNLENGEVLSWVKED